MIIVKKFCTKFSKPQDATIESWSKFVLRSGLSPTPSPGSSVCASLGLSLVSSLVNVLVQQLKILVKSSLAKDS